MPGNTGGAYAAPAAVRLGAALSARRQQASSSATRLSVLRRDISCTRELIRNGPDIQYFQIYGRISISADSLATVGLVYRYRPLAGYQIGEGYPLG